MRKLWLIPVGILFAMLPACDPPPSFAPPTQFGDWGLAVHEGGESGWSATPECWNGDNTNGSDSVDDHLVVGPEAFAVVEPHRLTAVGAGDNVVTRIRVTHQWLNSGAAPGSAGLWYSLRHHNEQTGLLTQTTTQALSFDFRDATDSYLNGLGAVPSVASGPLKWTVWVSFSVNTQVAQVTCATDVVVYHPDDPGIPAGAGVSANVPHPTQHAQIPAFAEVVEDQFAYIYPSGPNLGDPECDGHDDVTNTHNMGRKGQLRHEPDLEGTGGTLFTHDTWVFEDFGAGPMFSWRDRDTDVDNGLEYAQVGQAFNVVLPDGSLVQDHGGHTVVITSHWHESPDLHDTNGMICEGRFVIQ